MKHTVLRQLDVDALVFVVVRWDVVYNSDWKKGTVSTLLVRSWPPDCGAGR